MRGYIKQFDLSNKMENNKKDCIMILFNFFVAYSTFIGVLSAIIYYIADVKGISILIAQAIGIIYIVAALIISYWINKTINKEG